MGAFTAMLAQYGKKRPLGVTTWSDKLVAEVVRLILDAYFDIQMSEHSHGFREGRGCGSALREIYYTWRGTTWLIEGDRADCFGTLSHELLIPIPLLCGRIKEKMRKHKWKGMKILHGASNHPSGLASLGG